MVQDRGASLGVDRFALQSCAVELGDEACDGEDMHCEATQGEEHDAPRSISRPGVLRAAASRGEASRGDGCKEEQQLSTLPSRNS